MSKDGEIETAADCMFWLAPLPTHWRWQRLKFLAAIPLTNGLGAAAEHDDPTWHRYIRITDILDARTLRSDTFCSIPPQEVNNAGLQDGDILLAAVGATYGRSYLYRDLVGAACYAGYLVRYRHKSCADPSFVSYWTQSKSYWAQLNSNVIQSTIQNFSATKFRNLRVPLPSVGEQQGIAAFLDRETAKIDALVAEQERLLILLEEKRQAVIANAVTKGLDPTVQMKDSGIEWLCQVPLHWSVTRLAHYSSIENGSTPSRNDPRYWDGGDIAWVGSGEVNQYIINEPSEYVTALAIDECSLRIIPKGAVLIGLVGQGRTRAMSALLGIDAAINQNVAAVTAGRGLAPSYLHYSLQAAYEFLRECARGGNQAALNCEIISAFRIAIPPLQEQELIAAHLDAARDAVECLAMESRRSISLLNERRDALISAAVTGKLDVLTLFSATEPALAAE